jgi:hypothetical protein
VLEERFDPQDSRLARLIADIKALSAETEGPETAGPLPRIFIHDLALNEGSASFVDHVPARLVELNAGPVSVSVQELNTLPDRFGQQVVQIRLPDGATVRWQGNISLAPLHSEGELEIEDSRLDMTIAYLESMLPLDDIKAMLSARTRYRLSDQAGSLELALDGLELDLNDLSVTGLQPSSEFLSLERLEVRGGTLRYPQMEVALADIVVRGPRVAVRLNEDGRLALQDLVPAASEADPVEDRNATAGPAWSLSVDRFAIESGHVAWLDQHNSPAAEVVAESLNLALTKVDNAEGTVIPARLDGRLEGGGAFEVKGDLELLPAPAFRGTAGLTDIPLSLAQPYVEPLLQIGLDAGLLGTQTEVTFQQDKQLSLAGNLSIDRLSISDGSEHEKLLGWEKLDIDRYEADALARVIRISRVALQQPYGRIEINEDRSTNLDSLWVEQPAEEGEAVEEAAEPMAIVVGGIEVSDGSMDFTDRSLPLLFATFITDLDGTVSTIDTQSSEPAQIRMEGQVDEYGLARIDGAMNLFDPLAKTNITVEFRNLAMSDLSPYSVQFAGRKIAEGKLDLELLYAIDGGMLQGQNDIVLSDLLLGEKVEHPDAASLPLGLAVALLKDANGVIDIDLPVEGDVNDPEFRIGGVIWQAFVGLITKVVTAPFRLLGSLIGVDSEDLGQFQFLPGRFDLTPPELEKVAQLQEALQQRPQLVVEIGGVYDPVLDTPALQQFRLREIALERMGREAGEREGTDVEMMDEEIRATLETLYTERFPDSSLDMLKAEYTTPPADSKGKPELDQLAYSAGLWKRLWASEPIGQAELEALADQRAAALQEAFLVSGEFDPARVTVIAPSKVESEDGKWVSLELGMAANSGR